MQRHVESCLRCQAELARYRRMLRALQLLRTQFLEPTPGLLAPDPRRARRGGRAPRRPLAAHRHAASPTPAPSAAPSPPPAARPPRCSSPAPGAAATAVAQPGAGSTAASEGRCYLLGVPGPRAPEGSSSIGRAPVSKTGGWGFESLLPCCRPRTRQRDRPHQGGPREPTDQAPDGNARAPTGRARPSARPRPAGSAATERTGPRQYLGEVRGELRKVAWPTRREVVNSTIVVLIAVVFMTTLIFGFDYALVEVRPLPLRLTMTTFPKSRPLRRDSPSSAPSERAATSRSDTRPRSLADEQLATRRPTTPRRTPRGAARSRRRRAAEEEPRSGPSSRRAESDIVAEAEAPLGRSRSSQRSTPTSAEPMSALDRRRRRPRRSSRSTEPSSRTPSSSTSPRSRTRRPRHRPSRARTTGRATGTSSTPTPATRTR